MSSGADVRVIVIFTEEEVQILDDAVKRVNQFPGARATRSDIVRFGALGRASDILSLPAGAVPPIPAAGKTSEDTR